MPVGVGTPYGRYSRATRKTPYHMLVQAGALVHSDALSVSVAPTTNFVCKRSRFTPLTTRMAEQTDAVASNLPIDDRDFRAPARPLSLL